MKNYNSDKFTLLTSRFCHFILHLQCCTVCMVEGPWIPLRAQVSPLLRLQSKWSCTGTDNPVF